MPERERNRREVLIHRAGERIAGGRRRVAAPAPYGDAIHNWPYAARKWKAVAESGWRSPPDKNIEPVPRAKKMPKELPRTWDVRHNG
jgi:hypothetical protein